MKFGAVIKSGYRHKRRYEYIHIAVGIKDRCMMKLSFLLTSAFKIIVSIFDAVLRICQTIFRLLG